MPEVAYVMNTRQRLGFILPNEQVIQVGFFRVSAPRLAVSTIYCCVELRWRTLPFLISLRARHPKARIVNRSKQGADESSVARLLLALFDKNDPMPV